MNTQDIVETWRREAIQEGVKQGMEQGIEQGITRSLIDIYEVRFGAMPEGLRAVIEDTHDEPTLRAGSNSLEPAAQTGLLRPSTPFARSDPRRLFELCE